jgi:hypothetical protein
MIGLIVYWVNNYGYGFSFISVVPGESYSELVFQNFEYPNESIQAYKLGPQNDTINYIPFSSLERVI